VDLRAASATAGAGSAALAHLVHRASAAVDRVANLTVGGDVAEADEHQLLELKLVFKSIWVKHELKEGFQEWPKRPSCHEVDTSQVHGGCMNAARFLGG
jgi:hypothetical protein